MPQWGSNTTQTTLFIRSLQCCRRPCLSTRLMACKVLHDRHSTLSHQGRVSGQNAGKFAERGYCGWRTLENSPFSPVQVAMHQFLPSIESMPSCMQRKPFFPASAPQKDSLRPRIRQWWLFISFCICLTFFTTFGTPQV